MKRILIIGATSAIATACARIWAVQKAEFFLVARDNEKLTQVADDLLIHGASKVINYIMDVREQGSHAAMLESCLEHLRQIDIVLLAHGTLPNQHDCEQSVQQSMNEFTINGSAVIALLTPLASQLEKQGCGALGVISSVASDRGRASNYLYGSAKAAVSTFCQGLRVRLYKKGVSVTLIKPGFVDTPMTRGLSLPSALVVSPEKVARQIVPAIERGKAQVYTPRFWALIMLVIRNIPDLIFKRLNL